MLVTRVHDITPQAIFRDDFGFVRDLSCDEALFEEKCHPRG